jgi:hypothetical protein
MAEPTGSERRRGEAADPGQVDVAMEGIAAETGAALHRYPRPGQAVGQVVLLDHHDDGGSQVEMAVLEVDGSLRVSGHDQGSRVSRFFGSGITSYDWVCVIPAARVGNLVKALGGDEGGDVLGLVAAYHEQHGGRLDPVLRRPEVGTEFSNWHS